MENPNSKLANHITKLAHLMKKMCNIYSSYIPDVLVTSYYYAFDR